MLLFQNIKKLLPSVSESNRHLALAESVLLIQFIGLRAVTKLLNSASKRGFSLLLVENKHPVSTVKSRDHLHVSVGRTGNFFVIVIKEFESVECFFHSWESALRSTWLGTISLKTDRFGEDFNFWVLSLDHSVLSEGLQTKVTDGSYKTQTK